MSKPTLLYVSPFGPMKSGISDYSEVLVQALKKEFDITILIEDYQLSNQKIKDDFIVLKNGRDFIDFDQYDYRIYNIGNNPDFHGYIYEICLKYPGMIILHDLVLYYLFVGYYQRKDKLYSQTYLQEGIKALEILKMAEKKNRIGLLEQKQLAGMLSLNKELIKSGNKIMVHSWYSYNKLLESGLIKEDMIAKINLIALLNESDKNMPKEELFEKYNIPQNAIIVSSLGYISKTKLNHNVCRVIRDINKKSEKKVCYVMVGEGDYVNEYIDGKNIIKTGYTELDEFNSFIDYSDIIVNLRNPSMGETSASMLRIMQKGKACIINDGGWFTELPEECVLKVNVNSIEDDLFKLFNELILKPEMANEIGNRAKSYVDKEHNESVVVAGIKEFLFR